MVQFLHNDQLIDTEYAEKLGEGCHVFTFLKIMDIPLPAVLYRSGDLLYFVGTDPNGEQHIEYTDEEHAYKFLEENR